ncbi:hypothetical protein WEH80_18490 [Actinomycetes bacterium KLBMP 9759]
MQPPAPGRDDDRDTSDDDREAGGDRTRETQDDIFPTVHDNAQDAADAAALADAERAVARHGGTPEQREGVARAATARRAEDRLERWQAGR